jgi:hypothetical protein
MARYQHRDVESILKLFELELSTLHNLSRVEKMKIRKRVANAILPALAASNSEPDMFLNMVENKLRDVFDLFFDGWGFREKLHQRVNNIIKQKKQKAAG